MKHTPGEGTVSPPDSLASAAAPSLKKAIDRLSRGAVLVVGDVILDRWVHGKVERITPDAPVPVLGVVREVAVPGGAGNVVRNLGGLGTAVAFVSVVGDDQAGSDLTGLIGGQPGLEPWLLVQGGRATSHKTRLVAHGQQLLRVDREDAKPVHPKLAERVVRIASEAMAATSVTILSDYRKGVLTGGTAPELIAASRQAGRRVVVGSRGPDFARFAGADVLATGWPDLPPLNGETNETDANAAAAACELGRAHGIGAVVVVRTGMSLTLADRLLDAPEPARILHVRNQAAELVDVSGTGDTVLAVLGAALASGLDLVEGVELANLAASVVVGRVGTAVVHGRDMLTALAQPRGAKILDPEPAAERVERWRRVDLRIGFAQGMFGDAGDVGSAVLERARSACDRLIVALAQDARAGSGGLPQQARAERLAELPCVDLIILADGNSTADLLEALRPDLLVETAENSGAGARKNEADLVRGWGGRILLAAAD